jgi:MFS family permease
VVAGGLACIAILVVLLGLDGESAGAGAHAKNETDTETEAASPPTEVTAFAVFWRTKTSCFATFSYGYFQASVVLFLPLYLIASKNVPANRTILVTAFFAAGMLAMSTWAGRLGDRHGHLRVMRVLGAIGGTMVASFVLLPSFPLMCAAVFVAGATLASISPVSLALQGVVTPKADLGRANAFYNAAYAAGMLLGPPVSGLLFTTYGGAAMLFHLAALWAGFVVLTILFASDDPRHATPERACDAV